MFLKVREGNHLRDIAELQVGCPQLVGRLQTSDVVFPEDLEMSGRHLSIELLSDGTCRFKDLGSTNGTFLNDVWVQDGTLLPGDVLRCGMTCLCVEQTGQKVAPRHSHPPSQTTTGSSLVSVPTVVHGGTGTSPHAGAPGTTEVQNADKSLTQTTGFVAGDAKTIWVKFSLAEQVSPEPRDGEQPREYAVRLCQSCEQNQCLQFLACALPKRMAVWWLILCVRASESYKSDEDLPMLSAAEEWVRNPTDENRRRAMKAAENLQMATPASWAGVAAFWSHGSMAPPNVPAVPAAEDLCSKAVFGGVVLASVLHSPEKAPDRRSQFTQLAVRVAEGSLGWA